MVGRLLLALCTAGVLLAAPSHAPAQSGWSRTTLPSEVYWAHDAASTGPAEALLVHRTTAGTFATPHLVGGEPQPGQQLDSGWNFYPTVDASAAGGAVAAWYSEDAEEIRVAQRPVGAQRFERVAAVSGGRSDYSYGQPLVAVNDRGDAIVVYLAAVAGGQELRALYRPAGGAFGAPETIGETAPWSSMYPRGVALSPDGTAVVGLVRDRRAQVAVRPPAGPFGEPEQLGGTVPEHSWQAPQVGIDAAGDVVAVWLEGAGPNTAGAVRIAFRRVGQATFGAPQETGIEAHEYGRIRLGVSAVGEVVLVVEASTTNPHGGTHIEGLHAVMGNAGLGRIGRPAALTGIWGSYPSFAMNSRGDAVVVYDECCPMAVRAQRRLPLTGFGPVEDLQPPIEFEGSRGGIIVRTADVDELGNAWATYEDGELDETYLSRSLPAITDEPPAVPPLEDLISAVIGATPRPDPELPPLVTPPAGDVVVVPPPAAPPMEALRPRAIPDRVAPRLRLSAAPRLRGRRRPRVTARVRCSEACNVRLAGAVAGRRLRPVEVALRGQGSRTIGLAVSRRTARRIGRARRAPVARLAAVAVDRAGNATTRRLRVALRPAR